MAEAKQHHLEESSSVREVTGDEALREYAVRIREIEMEVARLRDMQEYLKYRRNVVRESFQDIVRTLVGISMRCRRAIAQGDTKGISPVAQEQEKWKDHLLYIKIILMKLEDGICSMQLNIRNLLSQRDGMMNDIAHIGVNSRPTLH